MDLHHRGDGYSLEGGPYTGTFTTIRRLTDLGFTRQEVRQLLESARQDSYQEGESDDDM